ncbi:MAG: hypothetical protein ACI4V0_09065, partial [Lachnospiraceae bacterium]
LSLNYAGKLQEKRFDFIKALANIISENLVEVSKIKYFKPNQQTLIKLLEGETIAVIKDQELGQASGIGNHSV